jgi:hypothetical protein
VPAIHGATFLASICPSPHIHVRAFAGTKTR